MSESVYTGVHEKVYGTKANPDAIEKFNESGIFVRCRFGTHSLIPIHPGLHKNSMAP